MEAPTRFRPKPALQGIRSVWTKPLSPDRKLPRSLAFQTAATYANQRANDKFMFTAMMRCAIAMRGT